MKKNLALLTLTLPYAYNLQGMNSGPKKEPLVIYVYDKRFPVWSKEEKHACTSFLPLAFGESHEHGEYETYHRTNPKSKEYKLVQFNYSPYLRLHPKLEHDLSYHMLAGACYILDDCPKNLYTIINYRYNYDRLQTYKQAKTVLEVRKAKKEMRWKESILNITAQEIKSHLQYDKKHLVKLVSWVQKDFFESQANWNIPKIIKEKIKTIEKQL